MSEVARYGGRYDYGVRRAARGVPRAKIVDRLKSARGELLTVRQLAETTGKRVDETRRYLIEMCDEGLAVRKKLENGSRFTFGYRLMTDEERREYFRQSEQG